MRQRAPATCDELAAVWPIRWPRPDLRSNERHATAVARFGETFKYRPIDSLRPEECRFFAEANPGHVRYLITMFNDAIGDGLLPKDANPFVGLRIHAKGGTKKPARVPTVDELTALEVAAHGTILRDALPFSAYTGVRLGECRAFSLDDLDSATLGQQVADRARVDWQLTSDERLKIPKKESRRRIMLPSKARKALVDRAEQLLYRDTPGFNGTRADRPRYWSITAGQWSTAWTGIKKEAGITLRWHDLRHHAATWLLDHGALVTDVAVQLGCSVLEVERTYGHPDPEKALARLQVLVDDD